MTAERYCDSDHCDRPAVPVTEENSIRVHLMAWTADAAIEVDRLLVDDAVSRVHLACFDRRRHRRV